MWLKTQGNNSGGGSGDISIKIVIPIRLQSITGQNTCCCVIKNIGWKKISMVRSTRWKVEDSSQWTESPTWTDNIPTSVDISNYSWLRITICQYGNGSSSATSYGEFDLE